LFRLVRQAHAGTRVVARFGLYGLLGLAPVARPGRSSATKATEETNLHPDPVFISTLGMATAAGKGANGPPGPTANQYA